MLLTEALSPEHWLEVQTELTHPSSPEIIPDSWQPKYDFGPLPSSLNGAIWSPQEFHRRGFPSNEIPVKIPATLLPDQWDLLTEQALRSGILDRGWLPHMEPVKSWLTEGCPPYLQYPGTSSTESGHKITASEMQITMEAMARFQIQVSCLHCKSL